MNRNKLLLIGGAVIIVLFYLFRNQGALGAANPILLPNGQIGYVPAAGPNTPVNTWGTAPYYAGGAYGAGSVRAGTIGPSASGSIGAGLSGLASAVSSLFKGSVPTTSQQGGPGAGTAGSYPGGTNQQPLDLLNAPPAPAINPATQPIVSSAYGPVSPAALTTFDNPPDIATPSLTPSIDLSALSTAPPSPIGAPVDFGASMDAAITNPSYYTVPSATVADYASPSYVYDGGEITT